MNPVLFSEFRLRELTLPNRVVVSPMAQYSAVHGNATDWHMIHYGGLSMSGAGLLIFEATSVHATAGTSDADLGLYSDDNEEAIKRVVDACRKYGGAKLGLQLQHAGRKGSVAAPWLGRRRLELDQGGWIPVSADAIPYPGRVVPHALTEAEITREIDAFAMAAERAARVGFDLLEIHAAHGYLLHNFLSPLTNQRKDRYGGSSQNRTRIVLDLFKAVRKVWPEDKPIGVRLSATDWVDGGWSVQDSAELARRLKELGCDFISVSSGGSVPEQNIRQYAGYQVPFAREIKEYADIPTIAVGLIRDAQQAESIVRNSDSDLVALAREMLYDPRWPWHAAAELKATTFFPPQYARANPLQDREEFMRAMEIRQ